MGLIRFGLRSTFSPAEPAKNNGTLFRFLGKADVCAAFGRALGKGGGRMSFAGDVKAELCRSKVGRKCCAQAEACGVLLYCNRFSLGEVKIVTESPAFAQRLPGCFAGPLGWNLTKRGTRAPRASGSFPSPPQTSSPCCGRPAPLTQLGPPTISTLACWRRTTAGWPFSGGPSWPAGR